MGDEYDLADEPKKKKPSRPPGETVPSKLPEQKQTLGYAGPQSRQAAARYSLRGGATRSGKIVIASQGANLGMRCVKCGGPGNNVLAKQYAWVPPLCYLALLLGLLPGAVVCMVFQKKGAVQFAMCDEHESARRKVLLAMWGCILGAVACLALSILIGANARASAAGPLVMIGVLGIIACVIAAAIVGQRAKGLYAAHIDDDELRLKGAGEGFLATLPQV